ncbi:hypothetical protein L917_19057, partial [Phytophthora nicotianae]
MLSRLHAKDPMSVDELLNPLDENTTAEDPTDEDFCGVGDQRWLKMALRPAQKALARIWS